MFKREKNISMNLHKEYIHKANILKRIFEYKLRCMDLKVKEA